MINKYLLYVEIPNYITHVKLSNRRRAKYYTTKSKIPKKYKNYKFNTENFLIDKLGNKIISNPKVVGTPNMKKINGQDFYRGGNNPIIRSKIVLKMKSFWTDKLKKCKKININQYPLKLSLDFYVPENENFDVW